MDLSFSIADFIIIIQSMGAYSFTLTIAILSSIIAISQFDIQTALVLALLGVGGWKMTEMLIPKVS